MVRTSREADTVFNNASAAEGMPSQITSITLHKNLHPSPPEELWTCDYDMHVFDSNLGRPIPVYVESPLMPTSLEFAGCYRIVRWKLHQAGSDDAVAYIAKRKSIQPGEKPQYWIELKKKDWMQVQLEKVVDPILIGNPKHKYVRRYALLRNKMRPPAPT